MTSAGETLMLTGQSFAGPGRPGACDDEIRMGARRTLAPNVGLRVPLFRNLVACARRDASPVR